MDYWERESCECSLLKDWPPLGDITMGLGPGTLPYERYRVINNKTYYDKMETKSLVSPTEKVVPTLGMGCWSPSGHMEINGMQITSLSRRVSWCNR